ncbi:MAG: sporulation protein YabP [Clostridia bacterium]|nr:sporulation protein YabP [Clostridia bacterium]
MESKQLSKKADCLHNIIMESRKKISVSGVEDVESFNEEEIILHTGMGVLIIRGCELHISKLSVDSGETVITGDISCLDYPENFGKSRSAGFLSRLLR